MSHGDPGEIKEPGRTGEGSAKTTAEGGEAETRDGGGGGREAEGAEEIEDIGSSYGEAGGAAKGAGVRQSTIVK